MRFLKRARLLAIAVLAVVALVYAETVVVKIQSTALRSNPSFISPAVATVKAGANLEQLATRNGWVQVKTAGGQVGWVHGSAVQTKKFTLAALGGNAKTKASASEVALAGKGFNKQVEDSYRAKNAKLDFAAVDRMVQLKATPEQVADFVKKGKLGEAGGGK